MARILDPGLYPASYPQIEGVLVSLVLSVVFLCHEGFAAPVQLHMAFAVFTEGSARGKGEDFPSSIAAASPLRHTHCMYASRRKAISDLLPCP